MKSKTKHIEETTYFYAPDILVDGLLPAEESAHAIRVLRKGQGDTLLVTDGQGTLYRTTILSADPTATYLSIDHIVKQDKGTRPLLRIGIAPTKNIDRIEWLVEKLTEVGISAIDIICTERTIRRKVNLDRIDKIITSAMKQSQKLIRPQLLWHDSLSRFLSLPMPNQKFIAHCDEDTERIDIKALFRPGIGSAFLIGPEGDFSPSEVEKSRSAGFVPVSLGSERLRTETAGLYVGMLHHILN